VHGEQTTASAYAGLGTRHILVLADGSVGEVPSRLAAQTACSAALARIRSSVLPELADTLVEAFAEAHHAVRRVLLGTVAQGKGQAALLVVSIDARGVVAARVGGGRVYLLRGDRLDALYRGGGPEGLGVGEVPPEPELIAGSEALGTGDRVLVLSESAVRPLAADLERLGAGGPPQLTASRLADAARRRGQLDPLSVHVVEIAGGAPRVGPHPALARITRDRPKTFDPEGHLMGRSERAPAAMRGGRARGGLAALGFMGVVLGIGTALVVDDLRRPAKAPPPPVPVTVIVPPPEVDVVEVKETVEVETAPEPADPEVMALFEAENATKVGRAIRGYIIKRFPEDGEEVFARLDKAILELHRRGDKERVGRIIEGLLELAREPELKRTAKWASELLPKLYAAP
jgi:hypothetical protein